MQKIVQLILVLAMAAVISNAHAHNKVVVIPMAGDDIMPKPFAPLTKHSPPTADYTITANTVIDNITGLEWQRDDHTTTVNWAAAVDYCINKIDDGHSDWRLPLVRELQSIVDYAVTISPTINQVAFTNTNTSYYWSASSYADSSSNAWAVNFSFGLVSANGKTGADYVRCVR